MLVHTHTHTHVEQLPLILSFPLDSQSIIRVVFHDRRLQYTEHQQLEGWRWNRPGDRILDLGEH